MDLFTRKDGTSIHYSTLGEGYPIVLIHTVLDNYSVFNQQQNWQNHFKLC